MANNADTGTLKNHLLFLWKKKEEMEVKLQMFLFSFSFFSWNQPKGRSSLSRQCKCFCKVQLPNVFWRLPVFVIERYLFKWTCWSFTGWEEPSHIWMVLFLPARPSSSDFTEDPQCWKPHHHEHIVHSGNILDHVDGIKLFILQNYMMKRKSIIYEQCQLVHTCSAMNKTKSHLLTENLCRKPVLRELTK